MDNYAELLSKISVNYKSFSPYTPLSEYNIFNVLEINEKEVIMCRLLADLLDPEGQHGCGILFLKSFLKDILKEYRMSDTLLAHTDVIKEFVIDNDRRMERVALKYGLELEKDAHYYSYDEKQPADVV